VLSATIRLKRGNTPSLDDLVGWGMLSGAAADLLVLLLRAQRNFLISGEAGSGKTTLLASVLHEANPAHVLRIVEEYREIDFTHELGQSYQIAPKSDDPQCRSIAGLLRFVLRMRPDIVVVGEVRGAEAWALPRAAGVGAGFAATIHAPHASGGLEALVLLSRGHEDRPEPDVIRETFSERIAVVVHCRRGTTPDGQYVHEVAEIRAVLPPVDASRLFSSEALFERVDGLGSPMRYTNLLPPVELVAQLEAHLAPGETLRDLLGAS
jgi:type IV secretory pathway ATPase VirB11/archaellum biosynthesis ATPase